MTDQELGCFRYFEPGLGNDVLNDVNGNVVVAVFLGWLILDEPMTGRTLIAAVAVLASVAWFRTGGRHHKRARTDDSGLESRSTEPPVIRSRVA